MPFNSSDYVNGVHKDYRGELIHLDYPSTGKLYCTGEAQPGGAWITNRAERATCPGCIAVDERMLREYEEKKARDAEAALAPPTSLPSVTSH